MPDSSRVQTVTFRLNKEHLSLSFYVFSCSWQAQSTPLTGSSGRQCQVLRYSVKVCESCWFCAVIGSQVPASPSLDWKNLTGWMFWRLVRANNLELWWLHGKTFSLAIDSRCVVCSLGIPRCSIRLHRLAFKLHLCYMNSVKLRNHAGEHIRWLQINLCYNRKGFS